MWLAEKSPLAERIAVTLPTPDEQPSRFRSQNPNASLSPSHSIPMVNPMSPSSSSAIPSAFVSESSFGSAHHEHAIDFATHSLDLATGGLKTLTAKIELPTRPDRRAPDIDMGPAPAQNYTFILLILACVVLMLIGGGIVLFVMLQP